MCGHKEADNPIRRDRLSFCFPSDAWHRSQTDRVATPLKEHVERGDRGGVGRDGRHDERRYGSVSIHPSLA